MPWQLPTIALLFVAVLLILSGNALRRRDGGRTDPASVEPLGAVPLALGDPLSDPAVQASQLDEATRITILLLGTDGRDEQDGPPRTDLMMLLVLRRDPARATLISLPRDLWVPIPDYGEGKINTAYFLGSLDDDGPGVARATVEGLLGIRVDHTVQVDFAGFRTLVDELGGVTVEVPEAIDDPEFPDGNYGTFRLQIPAGPQQMDGERALHYARTRHGSSDLERAARQQRILLALREQALQPSQLARAPTLLRTAYRIIESDLSLGDFFALARLGRSLEGDQIAMHTINGELLWPVITWNGQDALLYDPMELRATVHQWLGN